MDAAVALSIVSSILNILSRIGVWPIMMTLLFIIMGPWIFSLIVAWNQNKRFDAMKSMYENNVRLVESYEKMANGLLEVVALNTAKWTEVADKIDMNQFCPLMRVVKKRIEDIER